MNRVIPHINVFGARVVGGILTQLKSTLIVITNDILTLLQIKLLNKLFLPHHLFPASVAAAYSGSVVDNATHFCNFDY